MFNKSFLLVFSMLLLQFISFAQENSSGKFYEVIKDDSVKLFFNNRYQMVEKSCADYVRYTRIGQNAGFHGYFIDSTLDNHLLGKGRYVNGLKQGYFEVYYPSGNLKCKGYYSDDGPIGQWNFFYENGLPERTLKFTDTDTLLMSYADEKGKLTVENGNGSFYGKTASMRIGDREFISKGKVVNGKPDGVWVAELVPGRTFCTEKFKDGKMIEGTWAVVPTKKDDKKYYDDSHATLFFLDTHLNVLESFEKGRCYVEPPSGKGSMQYQFDWRDFQNDLRRKLDRTISKEINDNNGEDEGFGRTMEKEMTVEFTVNAQGKAENYRVISFWGDNLLYDVKESMQLKATFPVTSGKLYFHLKLSYTGGQMYSYGFYISSSSNIQ